MEERWDPMREGRSLLTGSAGRSGRSSTDSFLRVTLKAKGLVLLFCFPVSVQRLQLQSEKDPLCILLRRVLNGQLRGCWAWLSVMAGI